jgi:hypothetical protein
MLANWRTEPGGDGSPRARASRRVDAVLACAGVGAAIASTLFAGTMLSRTDSQPAVFGVEHLAIFAMPNRSASTRGGSGGFVDGQPVDPVRTGTIAPRQESAGGAARYRLYGVSGGQAWIATENGVLRVSEGAVLAGLGRVADIGVDASGPRVRLDSGAVLTVEPRGPGAGRRVPPGTLTTRAEILDGDAAR